MTLTQAADVLPRRPRWPWVLALFALLWIGLVRVPLILNADSHLDSDLAVDGLTVLEMLHGHWRWHFPGTPHVGIGVAALAAPQMALFGSSPLTLASGGVVAYSALVLATFAMAFSAFGARVAAWSLLPLAVGSTGLVWLSGRLTGGHLLAAAWHAGALGLLYGCLARGGPLRAAVLGFWCGLGLWHDSMFAVTIATIGLVGPVAWWKEGRSQAGYACALAFVAGLSLGDLPREIGKRLDPFDAYGRPFSPVFDTELLVEHARLLALECVPRLVVGHLLPDLSTEPQRAKLLGSPTTRRESLTCEPLAWATTVMGLSLFVGASLALMRNRPSSSSDHARAAVRWALIVSSVIVMLAFLLNRDIYDSDNYRYLIYLVVPWAVGIGVMLDAMAQRGLSGTLAVGLLASCFAALMTIDTARWYERLGWIDGSMNPVRGAMRDPVLTWLNEHRDVNMIYGSYWDVYRVSFLTGERVKGVPFPVYPNRFPEWSRSLPGGRPEVLVVRSRPAEMQFYQAAVHDGAHAVLRERNLAIYLWPVRR
jgi:hypothetical protein